MSNDPIAFVGGYGYTLKVNLKKLSDKTAHNITGDTISVVLRDSDGNKVTRTMTITDAANGIATYQITDLDFVGDAVEIVEAQVIRNNAAASKNIPFPPIPISVWRSL